jgi:selenocysteine lyase/cysteine desulfurase
MNLDTLISDEQIRVRLFPVTRDLTFLAHAAVAPPPAPVSAAIVDFVQRVSREGQFDHVLGDVETELRQLAARLLNVQAREIAFVSSTSAGLASIAEGLSWRAGDNVVIEQSAFPANIYPWLQLHRLGVRIRLIPWTTDPLGLRDLARFVDRQTRLVALSSAHFVSGRPVENISEIGRELRRHNILCCVDAIQTLGARCFPGDDVDFVVADGHKWLLATKGCGIMYVRGAVMDSLRPAFAGWRSVHNPASILTLQDFADTARRYEPGSLNELGMVGLHSALRLLAEFGAESIERRVRVLRQHLVAGLRERGVILFDRPDAGDWSGIVSFRIPAESASDTVDRLRRAGVVVSARRAPDGVSVVRVAAHFYNTDAELERMIDLL